MVPERQLGLRAARERWRIRGRVLQRSAEAFKGLVRLMASQQHVSQTRFRRRKLGKALEKGGEFALGGPEVSSLQPEPRLALPLGGDWIGAPRRRGEHELRERGDASRR